MYIGRKKPNKILLSRAVGTQYITFQTYSTHISSLYLCQMAVSTGRWMVENKHFLPKLCPYGVLVKYDTW